MTLFERIERILGKCRDEKITVHTYGEWLELRLHGLHPILHVRLMDDCIFERHIASSLRSRFEETGIPVLVCGKLACMYYSGPDAYRVMEGDIEDSLCRVIRGGIVRDEMFIASALLNLSRHHLPHLTQSLNIRGKDSVEFARFMGFDTALFPRRDMEVAGRYLLFRWISLYLLYRTTSLFRNDPVLLPSDEDSKSFLREMWNRYYSHLENLSDVKSSIGSPSSPDMKILAAWERLPRFTSDIHWITEFSGRAPGFPHIMSIASIVEEEETDILVSISRFVPDGNVAIFTPPFGLLPLQIYMEKRAGGLGHAESISSITVFTPPGAGEIFQSTVLNLAGEGVPYRPQVVGTTIPPMRWGEYAALLKRDMEGKPFSTILMDWRGRDDVSSLAPSVDYLWDVVRDRIILLLDRDERIASAFDAIFRTSRVEVMVNHSGSNSIALVITGRGRPSMNYTKLVHLKSPVERDITDVIENAENRLDSNMIRLNIPVRGARFYYYRDTVMWLVTSLQERFMKWGGLLLGLVPGYVWKSFAAHRWRPLKELARIHTEPCRGKVGRNGPDILLSEGKNGLELLDEAREPCTGIQLKEKDKLPLLRWFLPSRTAHILHRIFGIRELPVPDLVRYEGNPDEFLGRGEEDEYSGGGVRRGKTTVSELVELLKDYPGEDIAEILRERVFDERLRNRLKKAYSKKYGRLHQEIKGGKLF